MYTQGFDEESYRVAAHFQGAVDGRVIAHE